MKKIPAAIVVAWLGLGSLCMAGQPDSDRVQQIISACGQTANSYAYIRDRLMYEAYGNLFTDDAVFAIGTAEVVRRAANIGALKSRGASETTRHFITPVPMEVTGNDSATGISYLTLYATAGAPVAGKPLGIAGPAVVGEYHDEFRMTDAGCRFSARRVKLVFTGTKPKQ